LQLPGRHTSETLETVKILEVKFNIHVTEDAQRPRLSLLELHAMLSLRIRETVGIKAPILYAFLTLYKETC
jgi:hypothetical protein